jgi:Family of unknown function (DUF5691)
MSASEAARRWNSIASIATLGTNRAPPPLEKLWPSVSELPLPSGSPERALLRAAALSYLWQISGSRIATAEIPESEPAPAADGLLVSEKAAWRLARMLNGDHRDLVPEWLSLASRAGAVLPPHWLPVAMEKLEARELSIAAPVLGKRALWLAKRNPEWAASVASPEPSEERWVNGTLAERQVELAAIRVLDPAVGRDWLQRTWQSDAPDARVAFLETLLHAPGLSDADESFLEAALDDKRRDVRAAAVECLCRLPNSAHARRNLERLNPLVVLDAPASGLFSKLKKRRLEIQLPESLDKAAARDGINMKPPAQQKIGERAYWLMQMVSIARPSHWCERLNSDIGTFLEAALATDYGPDLLLALCEAAARFHDAEWILALCIRLLVFQGPPEMQHRVISAISRLLAAAPVTSRDSILGQLLNASSPSRFDLTQVVLGAVDIDWSVATTQRAFELLTAQARADALDYSYARNTLVTWSRRADVATASVALNRLLASCPDKSPWRNALDTLNENIEFRAAMRQELLT